jgi:predicted small metal-binding protein
MRKLTCAQVTGWTCEFEAEGDLNTQVKKKLRAHVEQVHAGEKEKMDEEQKKAFERDMEAKMSRMLPML